MIHLPFFILRNNNFKCLCGNSIFIGKKDLTNKRHGFCRCGLAWYVKNSEVYAKVEGN